MLNIRDLAHFGTRFVSGPQFGTHGSPFSAHMSSLRQTLRVLTLGRKACELLLLLFFRTSGLVMGRGNCLAVNTCN